MFRSLDDPMSSTPQKSVINSHVEKDESAEEEYFRCVVFFASIADRSLLLVHCHILKSNQFGVL